MAKALIVSRVKLSESVKNKIKEILSADELVDFYKYLNAWHDYRDILDVANKFECDTVAVIANFRLAVELLANGVNKVAILDIKGIPLNEIRDVDIYVIEGDIKLNRIEL